MKICKNGNEAIFSDSGWLQSIRIDGQIWLFGQETPGWSLKLAANTSNYYCNTEPKECKVSNDSIKLLYNSFQSDDTDTFQANVTVEWFWDEGLLCARINIASQPDSKIIDAIIFPDITLKTEERTILTLPEDTGGQIENIVEHLYNNPSIPDELIFKKLCMQVVGWEDGEKGLRIETHDKDGWIREFHAKAPSSKMVHLSMYHFLPHSINISDFTLPYSSGIGVFTGGWYGCAREYRKWALKQAWASRGRRERENSYVGKIACWCWNRGNSNDVCPPVTELSKQIGAPVALDWYWWHKHPYDMGYPDYFPPREGKDNFTNAIKKLHKDGNFVQVYTNGMSWDMELESWKQYGHKSNIILENGTPFGVVYNTWTNHRLGHICGSSSQWSEVVEKISDEIVDMNIDGLYLDQIATLGSTVRCFSDEHNHTPGGGSYATSGFRKLFKMIKKKYPEILLSSESTAEYFMDLLDANITLFSSFERIFMAHNPFYTIMKPIPFASAVYHGRMVMFGNYAIVDAIPPYDELWPQEGKPDQQKERDWHNIAPDQFAFELARTVSFGLQPMVAKLTMEHFREKRYSEYISFLIKLSKLYYENRNWLLWGRLMEPDGLVCDEHKMTFICRGVFTDPDAVKIFTRTYPAVLASTWIDDQSRVKTFIINYTQTPQQVLYNSPHDYINVSECKYLTNTEKSCFKGIVPPRSVECIEGTIASYN